MNFYEYLNNKRMKKIGLVGISWTSTVGYYRYINEEVNKRTGGLNYAECIIYRSLES